MEQRVIINLGEGNWQNGFPPVIVQLWELGSGVPMQLVGQLPADVELARLYERWRAYYRALNANLGLRQSQQMTAAIELDPDDITHVSTAAFEALCTELSDRFNAWLSASSFANVEKQLHRYLNSLEPVQVVITAQDPSVRRFPWHLWKFLDNYQQAEAAIGSVEYKKVKELNRQGRSQVRILSILGDSTGIQVEKDRKTLANIADTETVVLDERSRAEINQALWDKQGWDILCFSGHSISRIEEKAGEIQINPKESLSMGQLKYALKEAIKRGLQLAIFNSCDGMGLATELAELDIPYLVVMREPVPDPVAQLFLVNFLKSLAAGIPFSLAVKEARERLQGIESTFPCASWLPAICQNPISASLTWDSLQNNTASLTFKQGVTSFQKKQSARKAFSKKKIGLMLRTLMIASATVSLSLMAIRGVGLLEPVELQAYDHLLRLRPSEALDQNIVLVKVTTDDLKKYGSERLHDAALVQLIDKIEAHQPAVIGVDLYRAEPDGTTEERQALMDKFRNNLNLFTTCEVDAEVPAYKAPPEFISDDLLTRLGFSDFESDRFIGTNTIRRHFLAFNQNYIDRSNRCQVYNSLSLTLASTFLFHQGVEPLEYRENHLNMGKMIFRKLSDEDAGRFVGYQHLDPQDQIMLNFRPPDKHGEAFQWMTVSDVIEGTSAMDPSLIRGRVVLIGRANSDSKDSHNTPYGSMYGVELHAHMVSQLIEGAQINRKLIWALPSWNSLQWGDTLWVFVWSLATGLPVWTLRNRPMAKYAAVAVISVGLYLLCFKLILHAGWMPLVPAFCAIVITSAVVSSDKLSTFFD